MAKRWFDYEAFAGNAYQTAYLGPHTDTPHYAYDLQTPFHTPITAVLSGKVVEASYEPWGSEIYIKPDDTRYPEYYFYHPDVLEVKTGDHVAAGQEIALSGGENPGYPGAQHPTQTEYSNGPHTHVGWFTKWVSTPGGRKPFGPNTDSLIAIAKGQGNIIVNGQPTGSDPNGNTPLTTPAPAGLPSPGDIMGWVNNNVGQFLVRVGAGLAGLALIYVGASEMMHGLQGGGEEPAPTEKAPAEKSYMRRGKKEAPPPPGVAT